MTSLRPKRTYQLPLHLRPKTPAPQPRFGWRGFSSYLFLVAGFGAPQAYMAWQFTRQAGQLDLFWLLTVAWSIMCALFLVIARPWERIPR